MKTKRSYEKSLHVYIENGNVSGCVLLEEHEHYIRRNCELYAVVEVPHIWFRYARSTTNPLLGKIQLYRRERRPCSRLSIIAPLAGS